MLDSSSRRSTLHISRMYFSGARARLLPAVCSCLCWHFPLRYTISWGRTREIVLLRRELGKPATASLVDPSTDMVQALNRFLDWFVMARQIGRRSQTAAPGPYDEGGAATCIPGEIWQKIGPTLDFPKAHAPYYSGSEVLANGTIAYTETQVFETGHKQYVKKMTNLTHRKDQYICISTHHQRSACLFKLNQAVSLHAKVLARGKSEVDASRSSSSSSDSVESSDDDFAFDQRVSRPCEFAVKLPL